MKLLPGWNGLFGGGSAGGWGVLATLAGVGVLAGEPPQVKGLFPAGGATNGPALTVHVSGEWGAEPPRAWCLDPGVIFTAVGTNGDYQVRFTTNAALGAQWVRFYDTNGVSAPRLFVVTDLEEWIESQETNAPAPAVLTNFPVVINGRLVRPGEQDAWPIHCDTNEIVRARVDAIGLDSPVQASVALLGDDGIVLASGKPAAGFDPELTLTVPRAGTYRVVVQNAGGQGTNGPAAIYRLTLAKEFVGATNVTVAPGWLPPTDPAMLRPAPLSAFISPPAQINGWIPQAGDIDRFRLLARALMTYSLRLSCGSIGSPLIATIQVLDHEEKVVAESAPGPDPVLLWTAASDGEHVIKITGSGGSGGFDCYYALNVATPQVAISATLNHDTVRLAPGGTTELLVEVTRPQKMEGILAVLVDGLPPDVSAAPVSLTPEVNTARVVLSAAPDARPSNQSCSVIVTTVAAVPDATLAEAQVTPKFAPQGKLLRNGLPGFWLTVPAPGN